MLKWIKQLDSILLPKEKEQRAAPYIWLVYLFIYYFSMAYGKPSSSDYLLSTIGTFIFLILYFNSFRRSGLNLIPNLFGILLIGSYLATISPGASVFFVYAGSFCCCLGKPKKATLGLLFICVWIGFISFWWNLHQFFYLPAAIFTLMIGGVNIYQREIEKKHHELRLSQEEVKSLATTAERERIARDLHDLIGHTFSVITLKAELAGKLIDRDLDKTKVELKELELISRDALKQVREVVTGFRRGDLSSEFAHAKYVLESNDIRFTYEMADVELSDLVSKELAIIVKELVTNILKHARASAVTASLKVCSKFIKLSIRDDGIGLKSERSEGFGLKGINERVEYLKGSLAIQSDQGASFTITLPRESCL